MLYVSENQEREAGIQLKTVGKSKIDKVHYRVRTIARHMSEDVPDVLPPERGFLVKKLTNRQRRFLDQLLCPVIAFQNMNDQEDLRKIPIEECTEKMVSLADILKKRDVQADFSERPFHDACGAYANKKRIFHVREGVAWKIAPIFKALNEVDILPQVEDCWRPRDVQYGLLVRRVIGIARQHPDWTYETVKMVAMSLTASEPGLAGHQAGAAIDCRLKYLRGANDLLPLGNDYAEGGSISSIDFPYVTYSQWATRTIFQHAMQLGRFKLLRTENWHGSWGDRGLGRDQHAAHQEAKYGPIQDFDRKTGAIAPFNNDQLQKTYLPDDQLRTLIDESRELNGKAEAHTLSVLVAKQKERAETAACSPQ